MPKTTKAEYYRKQGIFYNSKTGDIFAPSLNVWIKPLLKDNNRKVQTFTFSIYPGVDEHAATLENGKEIKIKGTCPMNCKGCYAQSGCYTYGNVKLNIAVITWLCNNDLDFVERAINAQIKADNIDTIRIHATGDFFSADYIEMWRRVALNNPTVKMWTYTKYKPAENAFNDISNVNVVKSVIKNCGLNFGHIGYIIDTYNKLKGDGGKVHVCRCGIDKNQHCNNCKGCINNDYVLFIEHSTEYKANKDPLYKDIVELIENQPKQ